MKKKNNLGVITTIYPAEKEVKNDNLSKADYLNGYLIENNGVWGVVWNKNCSYQFIDASVDTSEFKRDDVIYFELKLSTDGIIDDERNAYRAFPIPKNVKFKKHCSLDWAFGQLFDSRGDVSSWENIFKQAKKMYQEEINEIIEQYARKQN
jgi:hypothetical protein